MANMKHAFGWVPDLPDNRDLTYSVYRPVRLPDSVDLRPQMPPVYDQGELGSCTANAVAAAFDFDRHSQGKPFMSPSRLFIYYNERAKEGTIQSDSGAQIRDGIKVLNKLGVTAEKHWPYDVAQFAKKPTIAAFKDALKNQSTAYARVPQSIDQIKQALAQGHPVVIGFTVYESFESEEVANSGMMPMPSRGEKVLGGHAVLVVGYDADGWIVRNSWGDGWGKHGYFSMPYTYLTGSQLSSDFWVITGVEV